MLRRHRLAFLQLTDFIAPMVPIGLGAGRLGNFINQELPGRVTDVPWAIIYPEYGPQPRHPSELYEFLLEGVILFTILWWVSRQPRRRGLIGDEPQLRIGAPHELYRKPEDAVQQQEQT